MSNKNEQSNPYAARATQAAIETDELIPMEVDMTELVSKIIPNGADRMKLSILIERIQEAENHNRRKAALLEGLARNGKIVMALLQNLGRWL